MKDFLFRIPVLLLSLFVMEANAQHFNIHNSITLPDKSQQSTVVQRIGYTDITISYHSPGTRGREVWGSLVPYGKVWRAGANENTLFTITHDVKIEGKELSAGTYGLHLLPEKDQWTFIFSKNHTSWGSYFYDEQEDAIRVTVPVEDAPEPRDWLSFDFHKRERGQASVLLSWGDKRAGFDLSLAIDDIALDHIRKQLRSDAYWEWFSWCQAADYCATYKINTKEAIQWVERSIELRENFSNWDVKAKLLRQSGDEKGAQQAMNRAIEVGSDIYLERYGRRLLREKNFEQAEYVFGKALEKNKTYWRAHFNRGNALQAMNNKKAALKAFETALKYAPEGRKEQVKQSIASL
ncbi:DUF2911 domain-containing protein [Fulvivirga sp. M361]|uniref:DUF2911 domain-containing protein n=1 Tax=Fulvivirga sp. M361 TaxID=2594266 RepID=UPI00117AFDCC|nr:DUF2911 domain-containing protein [Fulvivirga sp. M361]TRX60637.1 DUF2911 domain-containing protein [Fulvivirga sp. M361]